MLQTAPVAGLPMRHALMMHPMTQERNPVENPPAPASAIAGPTWPQLLALALVITLSGQAIPIWILETLHYGFLQPIYARLYEDRELIFRLLTMSVGLLLALSAPRRSGIAQMRLRGVWGKSLFVCAVPVLLTAIIYPHLPVRPFDKPVVYHLADRAARRRSHFHRLPLRPFRAAR